MLCKEITSQLISRNIFFGESKFFISYTTQHINNFIHFSYRNAWNPTEKHFLKPLDIKPKEVPKPTMKDIASQKGVKQTVDGWKIHLVNGQMEDFINIEIERTNKLRELQTKLTIHSFPQVKFDVYKTNELVKGNIQRSKIVQVRHNNIPQKLSIYFL